MREQTADAAAVLAGTSRAERNSTTAFPVPMELLRLVDKAAAEAARGD